MELILQLQAEYQAGMDFKNGRVKDWQATEDLYFGRVKKSIKGRSNVPLPIMSGFINTLLSKIDEPLSLKFKPTEESDTRIGDKCTAMYEKDSKNSDADWNTKDLDGKKLCAFYGRAIFKSYGESDPKYKFNHFVVDPYDFYVDPMGGGDLEDAKYCGEDGIFKSKKQLISGAQQGIYENQVVDELVNNVGESQNLDNDDKYKSKASRFSALGLSNDQYNFAGGGWFRCIESGTMWEGERWYVLWSQEKNKIIRKEKLSEMFKSNLWMWTSWAAYRDKFNFWSLAPADDVRPVAETIKVLASQELDNRQKNNWGQRAYDPEMFPNADDLDWRPDGKVAVSAGSTKVRSIASGIYQFETPQLNGTINLVQWLDGMVGEKTGVTAAAQGNANEQKVGIYYGNLQQVADRLGLINKSYASCHKAIGRRYLWALSEHLNKKQAVRILGANGLVWDSLIKRDVNPEMDIIVEGSAAELEADTIKKKDQQAGLQTIISNPLLLGQSNPKWILEKTLLASSFSDEDVRAGLDVESYANREVLLRAAEAIDDIINGRETKLYRGANTAFLQKILDFATDEAEEKEVYVKLINYIEAHSLIVMENMNRKLMLKQMQAPVLPSVPAEQSGQSEQFGQPAPNTMAGTAGRSQEMVPQLA